MKKSLKLNKKIRLIPENYYDVLKASIVNIGNESFSLRLDEGSSQATNLINKKLEVSITNQSYLISFESLDHYLCEDLLCIKYPDLFKKVQRREYNRVNVNLPIMLASHTQTAFNVVVKNLSGGGMQLLTNQKVAEGDLFSAKIQISNNKIIETSFQVLRVETVDANQEEYLVAGSFENISNIDRISVIQYCFKKQLENRCLSSLDTNLSRR